MFFRKRKTVVNKSLIIFLILALIGFFGVRLFILVESRFKPTVVSIAEVRADVIATEAINNAVSENVARGILYKDLIILEKDYDGRIIMAQTNTMEVNRLMAETTIRVQDALKATQGESIEIPLGQAFNSHLLASYGPRLPIRMIPIGRVNTSIIDVFESAGINQTRHKIFLEINAEVQIVVPFVSSEIEVVTTVPIADNIYIGEVPDTVINLQIPGQQHFDLPGFN